MSALQIIATNEAGNENKFILREENLSKIIEKIPADMKVSVVSVVGAFRTGKSFLLNLFIRYLRDSREGDFSQNWMISEGEALIEGNMNEGWSIIEGESTDVKEKRENFFGWRGGQERQTTGIWMWSEPFIRTSKVTNGEKVAVLLMDTQGMFDNETTMTLTAQIFGLSTLISSFQIYNVDKRIQEDNLQHLALFSEYGRMALLPKNEQMKDLLENKLKEHSKLPSPENIKEEEEPKAVQEGKDEETSKPPATHSDNKAVEGEEVVGDGGVKESEEIIAKPFQHLQFLVRDWQSFNDEDESEILEGKLDEGEHWSKYEKLQQHMQEYVQGVLKVRNYSDLISTREQIERCFEKLDCFLLPHPGFAVTKKNYDGSIKKIEPFFRALINYYVRLVFDIELAPKTMNNKLALTGKELQLFINIYVKMFQSEGDNFPKAMTVLDATAEGNNRLALDRAIELYKKLFDKHAGPESGQYIHEKTLYEMHEKQIQQCFQVFDSIATMGMPSTIRKYREQLLQSIEDQKNRYFTTNALRNPFRDLEYYLLPIVIAIVAWILAVLTDWTCSTDFCENVEDTFQNVYLFIFFVGLFLFRNYLLGYMKYIQDIVWPMLKARMEEVKNHHANTITGGAKEQKEKKRKN